jgi:hypothetical protein
MRRMVARAVLIATVCAFAAVSASAQGISFLPRQDYAVGDDPRSEAFGDFNSDGLTDIVVANDAGNGTGAPSTLSVLLGNGNGTFALSSSIPTESLPYFITTADFNGDHAPDVAVAHIDRSRLSIFLGNGRGEFSRAITVPTEGQPFSVTAARINNDATLDLVVGAYVGFRGGPGHVEILLGNGDGTFRSTGNWDPQSGGILYVAVADFDRDSIADVVATMGVGVSVLFGNGDGTLRFGPAIRTGGARGIVAGDFNGDGAPDFAYAAFDSVRSRVEVVLGNGNGTFQPPALFPTGTSPWGMSGADLNADGIFDLVTANQGSNTISVLPGIGNGAFGEPINIEVGNTPYFAGISDFNFDGMPDLAVTNSVSNTVSILLNNVSPAGSIWATLVNASAGQNSLTKFGGCDGCYDAGGATRTAVGSGDATVEFSFPETMGLREVGLSDAFSVTNAGSIDFGLRIQNGYAEVRENGTYRWDIPAEPGAVFRIAVQNGTVTYWKNGAVFYTSTARVQYPFVFGVILGSLNSGVQGVVFSGGGAPPSPTTPPSPGSQFATWSSMAHVSIEGSTVKKIGGCDGCYDAFVQAEQTVGSNGYVEFTISNPAPFLMTGLAHTFTPSDISSIDFGIRIQGGYAEVRENGVYRSDIAVQPDAVFRISITGGTVSYSKDGFVFYSGPASPGTSSFVAMFASLDASISNVVIANAP